MTDIVDRLRRIANAASQPHSPAAIAADEIERLQAEVAELKARLDLRDADEWRDAMEQRERRERDIYDPEESPC